MSFITENTKETPIGKSILLYLFLVIFGLLIGSLAALAIPLMGHGSISSLKWGQAISSTFLFILPPIVLYSVSGNQNGNDASLTVRKLPDLFNPLLDFPCVPTAHRILLSAEFHLADVYDPVIPVDDEVDLHSRIFIVSIHGPG